MENGKNPLFNFENYILVLNKFVNFKNEKNEVLKQSSVEKKWP